MSEAPAGEVESYDWRIPHNEWSGNRYPSGETLTGEFSSYGDYEVELEITDNGGGTDTITKTISVDGERPTAEFDVDPSDPNPGEEVEIDASGSEAPAGEITSYDWRIQHNEWSGNRYPSGEKIDGSFEGVEEYEIELEVTDNGGATDTVTKTIDVGGDGPTADFDISPSSPAPNQEVVFDASDSNTVAGDITTYDWEYETVEGDTSASGESPTHSFGDYGEFSVSLTVTDEYGRSDSIDNKVEVSGEGPTADFEFSPSDPELDERIVFDGSVSTEPDLTIEEYRWYINGEQRGSGSQLDVVFDEAGVYNIELEVENTGGKTDRIDENLRVGDEADIIDNPDFELVRDSPESKSIDVNPGETVSFISELESEEIPEATRVLYVDGEFINRSNVDSRTLRSTYQFQDVGEHTVEIEVEGAAGKSDVAQWDVTTHRFNSLPTVTDQSSTETVGTDSGTEILTFSIQNPEANDLEIDAEIIAELPDGVSISAASGVSTGDASVQTSSVTIAPGHQESMRLDVNIEDDSLDGQQLTIPYQVRYQPVGDSNVTYTPAEQELEIAVEDTQNSEDTQNNESESSDQSTDVSGDGTTEDGIPGFSVVSAVISILLLMVGARKL
jgi:hypothetical protein